MISALLPIFPGLAGVAVLPAVMVVTDESVITLCCVLPELQAVSNKVHAAATAEVKLNM